MLEFADGCGAYATGLNAAAGAGSDYTWTTEPPATPLEPPYDGLYFDPAPR